MSKSNRRKLLNSSLPALRRVITELEAVAELPTYFETDPGHPPDASVDVCVTGGSWRPGMDGYVCSEPWEAKILLCAIREIEVETEKRIAAL